MNGEKVHAHIFTITLFVFRVNHLLSCHTHGIKMKTISYLCIIYVFAFHVFLICEMCATGDICASVTSHCLHPLQGPGGAYGCLNCPTTGTQRSSSEKDPTEGKFGLGFYKKYLEEYLIFIFI